jgi:hypothetical protein
MKFYLTFGQVHAHSFAGKTFDRDCVAVIEAPDYETARERAVKAFGLAWAFLRPDQPDMTYFPRGLIDLDLTEPKSVARETPEPVRCTDCGSAIVWATYRGARIALDPRVLVFNVESHGSQVTAERHVGALALHACSGPITARLQSIAELRAAQLVAHLNTPGTTPDQARWFIAAALADAAREAEAERS